MPSTSATGGSTDFCSAGNETKSFLTSLLLHLSPLPEYRNEQMASVSYIHHSKHSQARLFTERQCKAVILGFARQATTWHGFAWLPASQGD